MDAHEVNRVRAKLALFVADVFASVPRKDQRAKGDCYLRGLMLDGRRKSIQAMASRLPDGNEQNLQQFVNQSTWDPVPVQRRICERMLPLIGPAAWVIDDVSVPKDGRMSAGVAPQYCGALGKRANCQVAVSIHAATDTASCPLQWRLFLPEEWVSDTVRRDLARIPADVTHREKWRLALDMLDTLAGWGMRPPAVVADAAYGTNAHLRAALSDRQVAYVLAVRGDVTAHPLDAEPEAPARNGHVGCWPQPRYRHPAPSLAALAAGLDQDAFTPLTWRHGSRGELRSRFAAVRVRPAGKAVERPIKAAASAGQGWWDGILPDCWLLVEWPSGAEAPTDYWLSNLPADTPIADLVRLAKVRWRIEHDYRELKHGLGLDHFEGRSWPGWHHHVTLVTAAHAFLTEQRLAPKVPGPVSPSTKSSRPSRTS
ncbi:IS701 family transposase [Streptomyces sp. NL15-2K]|uniref:IS701 family transposase n=2 Tax=Streptomyces sp. NL15-2K TaxID=376149 RepID=UPI0026F1F277|nr:IS701 family transposase [Kutzneria buriramensis]WKX06381.1 IS701 family transposase [Kutzneria buriramensis]WKX13849.1 IS701 family transposase [Kutzneria buriramensis]WKX15735.1 IS701 family transposase [Kutzneria buriramensis]WKX15893.1 IS701 family transposase [Kutzneria buriramensis]